MSDAPRITTVRLTPPRRTGNTVRFEWTVEPTSSLYRETAFELRFPDSVDLARVPDGVWLRAMMICLHAHWSLLRPCRIVLPRSLPAGEREYWQRLTDAVTWTLEGRVEGEDFVKRTQRSIEFVESGPPAEPMLKADDNDIVAACFSGGRDSLTQLALLQELGETPLLVTTTSPRAGSDEMVTARRRYVIDEIQRRRGVELVEVESDLRACVENDAELARHYGAGVNEITDTFLYFVVAWVTAYARGARSVLLASEAEVQESRRRDGMILQHKHFMYSAATQRALGALIAPSGISYGGLTSPLHQFQLQRLLGSRFDDIRDLQYSCWSQRPGEDACSRCGECFTIAVNMLIDGVNPREIGIDTSMLLAAQRDWWPASYDPAYDAQVRSRGYVDGQVLRFLNSHDRDEVEAVIAPERLDDAAVAALARLRQVASEVETPGPEPGFRVGFLRLIDDRMRERLGAIYESHFDPEPEASYADLLENTLTLSDWIAAPLAAAKGAVVSSPRRSAPLVPNPPAAAEPTASQLSRIEHLVPGPEPELERGDSGAGSAGRHLPVADTELDGNELAYVTEAIESNWVSSAGPYVERLEKMFAAYCGTRHAVTTASGASALEIMLRAAGIGPGDEIILPSFTMVATANAIHHVGAKPVFVDSDLSSWNMDLDLVRLAIGPRTRGIVAMHTYGHPVDMDELRKLADRNGLALFEDAAEAHGATLRGRRAGSLADAAAFSFYGNKIITTGEGGIITTDDDAIAQTARDLRSHSFSADRHFWHRRRAFNFRMSNLQAAVGIAQLERIDAFLERRRELADRYRRHLGSIAGISLPPTQPEFESANWMFGVLVHDDFGCSRDELRTELAKDSIETRTFFVPLHIQPAYLDDNDGRSLPVAERMGRQGLYLPSALWLEEHDVARIAERIDQAAGRASREISSPNLV